MKTNNSNRALGRRGFAAVLAVLLLTTGAASVISAGRSAGEGARISRLAIESARARHAAQGGAAIVLSAQRIGAGAGEIVTDPALGLITFEQTTENNSTTWTIRATSGDAVARRIVTN